jgi:hypothetical protein
LGHKGKGKGKGKSHSKGRGRGRPAFGRGRGYSNSHSSSHYQPQQQVVRLDNNNRDFDDRQCWNCGAYGHLSGACEAAWKNHNSSKIRISAYQQIPYGQQQQQDDAHFSQQEPAEHPDIKPNGSPNHNTNFTKGYGKEKVYTVLESEYASMKHQHSIA